MPFPVTSRAIFKNNPLDNVICQLRYPTILEIDSKPPADFQKLIKKTFPKLNEKKQLTDNLPAEMSQFLQLNQNLLGGIPIKPTYEFISRKNDWRLVLDSGSIALSTSNYVRWEEFRDILEKAVEALDKVYEPPFFNRVGLRYVNAIIRSKVGIDKTTPWSELLAPHIVGTLSKPEISNHVREYVSTTLIDLVDDLGQVRIATGLGKDQVTGEEGFVIDNDFFTEKEIEVKDVFDTLTKFNERSGRAFNWSISDRLRSALEPEPVTE